MFQNYKEGLINHKISPTTQRVKILEFLDKNRIHPTAEQVYLGLKNNMISLSKATVYNTLKLFVESGLIHELTVFENETRYEYNTENHIHFKCIKCGNIFDIHEGNQIFAKSAINGHKIFDYQINLRGICNSCLNKDGEYNA